MSILNCVNDDSCSTKITNSDLVTYLGVDLLCANIQTSEQLTEIVQNLEYAICNISDAINECCPTTTTTTSSTTTTTSSTTTTTTTAPPTTTTTTTAANYLEPCTVLVNYGQNVYGYDPDANTTTFLGSYAPGGNDIANTATKMWLYSSTLIYEYNITLSPWTAVLNRTISLPAGVVLGQGLCAISNTLLFASNTYPGGATPEKIIRLDITGSTAVSTDIVSLLPAGTTVSGDILYNSPSLMVTTKNGATDQLRQYNLFSGNLEITVGLPSFSLSVGLFENAGNLYIFTGGGLIREVNLTYPYTVTTVENAFQFISGASQQPSCIDVSLQTTTTTTSTSTTSTTTTTTTTEYLPTVLICGNRWTTRNLDVTTYRNGDPIPQVTDPVAWAALTTGAWCYYNNDPANGAIYGKLYNWYAVNDPRGLAPVGYHIPTYTEFYDLTDECLGGSIVAGGKLKEIGISHWASPNVGATNEVGFTALPGGSRFPSGSFLEITLYGIFWTSTVATPPFSYYFLFSYANTGVAYGAGGGFAHGMSVRLVKD
jgi:uncharacterized protein (TIGR02145 family)